jgi:hypothetical protein
MTGEPIIWVDPDRLPDGCALPPRTTTRHTVLIQPAPDGGIMITEEHEWLPEEWRTLLAALPKPLANLMTWTTANEAETAHHQPGGWNT